jgi:hypothetical protein
MIWNLVLRAVVVYVLLAGSAYGHDKWANGNPIPSWVKARCCNNNDAVDLGGAGRVHPIVTDNVVVAYRVDGFNNEVKAARVFPSQDGDVWAFYSHTHWYWDKGENAYHEEELKDVSNMQIWCLFVPCAPAPQATDPVDQMPPELNSECG